MEKIKILKRNSLIKNVDFSSAFYERISALFIELAGLHSDDPETYQFHLETGAILMATLDEAAEKQGLVEESALEDSGVENTDAG